MIPARARARNPSQQCQVGSAVLPSVRALHRVTSRPHGERTTVAQRQSRRQSARICGSRNPRVACGADQVRDRVRRARRNPRRRAARVGRCRAWRPCVPQPATVVRVAWRSPASPPRTCLSAQPLQSDRGLLARTRKPCSSEQATRARADCSLEHAASWPCGDRAASWPCADRAASVAAFPADPPSPRYPRNRRRLSPVLRNGAEVVWARRGLQELSGTQRRSISRGQGFALIESVTAIVARRPLGPSPGPGALASRTSPASLVHSDIWSTAI